MLDAKHLQQIDETLFESGDWLRAASPGPAVRELRVRHGALVRVVGSWKTAPPHPDQLAAMLECVSELCGAIVRACNPSAGDASALMRRTGRPSHSALRPSVHPSGRPIARASIRPDARRTAPPGRHRPAAALAMRPPPLPNVFLRTTRPPPRPASEPPEP
jgi:hypothetical protein